MEAGPGGPIRVVDEKSENTRTSEAAHAAASCNMGRLFLQACGGAHVPCPVTRLRWRGLGPMLGSAFVKAAEPVSLPPFMPRGRDWRCPELFP